jgi:hypothetical protein
LAFFAFSGFASLLFLVLKGAGSDASFWGSAGFLLAGRIAAFLAEGFGFGEVEVGLSEAGAADFADLDRAVLLGEAALAARPFAGVGDSVPGVSLVSAAMIPSENVLRTE